MCGCLTPVGDPRRTLGLGRVALLAYNPLWLDKRRALDMGLPYAHADWMADGAISDCRKVFEDAGVNVLV